MMVIFRAPSEWNKFKKNRCEYHHEGGDPKQYPCGVVSLWNPNPQSMSIKHTFVYVEDALQLVRQQHPLPHLLDLPPQKK
jgi:hypothetical protein